MIEEINYGDLTYHYKDQDVDDWSFNNFDNVFSCLKDIRNGGKTLEKAKYKII